MSDKVVDGECHAIESMRCFYTKDDGAVDSVSSQNDKGFVDPRRCDLCQSETSSVTFEIVDNKCHEIVNRSC